MQPLRQDPTQLMEQGVIKDDLIEFKPSAWDGRSIQLQRFIVHDFIVAVLAKSERHIW